MSHGLSVGRVPPYHRPLARHIDPLGALDSAAGLGNFSKRQRFATLLHEDEMR